MKKILFLFITIPFLALGQSQDQNYVKTTVYKTPNTAPIANPNIATASIKVDYFDGLGRPIQQVLHRQSGSGNDMIVHIDYDDFGRQEKEYLPYVNQSPSLSFDSNAETNQLNYYLNSNTGIEATNNPFSQKEFESSPIGRVTKQAAPGYDWRMGGGHEIKFEYDLNKFSDEIFLFDVSRTFDNALGLYNYGLNCLGYHKANTLYKIISKNENYVSGVDNTVEEYKDNLGRVLLKRAYENSQKHDTYYIYDKVGNLVYVIPPLASELIASVSTSQQPITYYKQDYLVSDFLINSNGSPAGAGGGMSIIIENGTIRLQFSAGFSSATFDLSKQHLINTPNPVPDVTLGYIDFNYQGNHQFIAKIQNSKLLFEDYTPNQPVLYFTSLPGIAQNLTKPINIDLGYETVTTASTNLSVLDGICYQYKYDEYNRLVEKKLPGKQWEFIVYDKLDRVVMTGPALSPFTSPTGNGWMITKYDVFSRPILTAWMSGTVTSATRKTNQDSRNTATVLNESKTTSNTTINGVGFRYTTTSLPTSGYHVLTVNYYDNYDTGLTFTPAISYSDIHGQALLNNTAGNKPVGLPTVSWVRVPETTSLYKHEKSYTLYDKKGRTVRTFKNNYLTGYLQTDQKLQPITGRVDFTETLHKRLTANPELYVKDVFTYTDQDRLLSHTHQIGTSGTPQLLAKNEYDELGQLISKQVGGTDVTTFVGLQKVDYRYNIRGWLKSINDIDNLSQSGSPTDLFAFKLNYNTIENESIHAGKELFNGNISETYWRTNNDNFKRKYSYHYDEQNRMKSAIYQRPNNSSPLRNNYDEHVFYDKNGNITQLIRNGEQDDIYDELMIDYLYYTYHPTIKNRLMKVMDETNSPAGFDDDSDGITDSDDDYRYDDFGNMTQDDNKGIQTISYNHLNLPVQITFSGATTRKINYLYNATGVKVKKIVTDGTLITETDYLDGYQYVKEGSNPVALTFFPHAEGYVNNTVVNNANVYNYVYNYTDHLGNVRVVYTKDPTDGLVKILEENNYYPFGMKHKNYNMDRRTYGRIQQGLMIEPVCSTCPMYYNYKYQGQERQDELGLNWDSFKYRNYDYAIGRFMNIDPLAAKYPYNSTYAFSENKVVMYNELEGLETGPAYWMVYTPTAKSAGVTPTTWNKLYQRNEAPSQAEATIVDITPVVGDAKGFVETFTGSDLMTGEKLGWGSRVLGLFMLSEFRVAGKVGDVFKSGKWIDTGENMSDAASSFQKQITGVDASQSFKLNGVKFDGITDSGVLLDAKSGMGNFVGKDGNFKNWFKGADSLIDQANRQLKAADGIKIQWHFENKKVMEATQKLFKKNDIEGIELIHTPRK